ncbi:MAG: sigma-54-dependent Fis family transcriptional regulator [Planctomycetes bacterium]|nr:sigma-54-dependent Fis family transcriptional regulator [Planctomycetota bacterium]
MNRVLIVEDEPDVGRGILLVLEAEGIRAETVGSAEEALVRIQHSAFDVLVTDYKLGRMDGIELLKRVKVAWPSTRIVVITAFGTIEKAVEAMSHGATRYLTKPFQAAELVSTVQEALEETTLAHQLEELRERLAQEAGYGDIITRDRQMLEVLAAVEKIAPTVAPVLIEGETGTGKELLARLLHRRSPRAHNEFIAINTSALPESLLEAELFGYSKGAFTGASSDKKGYLLAAEKGTILLDEVCSMPLPFQAKLLRVLEQMEVTPLGTTQPVKADFRVICASNRSLSDLVSEEKFRADLFYRLSVVRLKLPPLRERPGDIPLLAEHFVMRCAELYPMPAKVIDPASHKLLATYSWPGNVRELWNVIQHAFLLTEGETISPSDIILHRVPLPASLDVPFFFDLPYEKAREQVMSTFQREYLSRLIQNSRGNLSEVGRRSGLTRTAVYKIIKKLGLEVS